MSENEITIQINTQVDETQLEQLKSIMEDLTGKEVNILIDTNVDEIQEEVDRVFNAMYGFSDEVIGVDFEVSPEIFAQLSEVEQQALELEGLAPVITPEIDSSGMEKLKNETSETKKEANEAISEFGGLNEAISLIGGAIAATGILSFLDEVASSASNVEEQFYAMTLNLDLDASGLAEAKGVINELNEDTLVSKGSIRGFINQLGLMGVKSPELATGIMDLSAKLSYLRTGSNDAAESISTLFANSIGSGKMMERAFIRNGISLDEMASRAGMTKESMLDLYESMSPTERASFLTQYAGDAEDLEEAGKRLPYTWDALKDKIDQKIGAIATSIGQTVLPVLKPALDFIGDAVQGVADFIGVLPDGAKVALGITIIGTALAVLGAILVPLIPIAWAAIAPFLVAAAPFILVAAAIGLVVAAIYEVGKAMGWWTDFSSMLDAIKGGVMRLWSAFVNNEHVQAVIQWLKDAWQGLMDFLKPVFDAINGWWSSLFPEQSGEFDIVRSIIDIFGLLGEAVGFLVDSYVAYWTMLWDILSMVASFIFDVFLAAWDGLLIILTAVYTFLTYVYNGFMIIWNAIIMLVNIIYGAFMSAWNALKAIIMSVINTAISYFNNFKNKVMVVVTTVIGYWNQFKQGVNTAVDAVKGFVDGLVSKFLDMKNKVMSYLQPIIDGIKWIMGNQDNVDGGSGGSPFEETHYNGSGAGSPFEEASAKGENWYPSNNGEVVNNFYGLVTERDVANLIIKTVEDYMALEATRS